MSSRLPPTPADNLSRKGTGEQTHSEQQPGTVRAAGDPEKQGQQGNAHVNTTHQGYQQDR